MTETTQDGNNVEVAKLPGDPFRRGYGKLTEDQRRWMDSVKRKAESLLLEYEAAAFALQCQGRHMSIAKTELETSVMWAVKAITATEGQDK